MTLQFPHDKAPCVIQTAGHREESPVINRQPHSIVGKVNSKKRLRPSRRGFTMLEMVTVIGIILLLLTMAVIGFRYVEYSNSRNRTRVALHDANGFITAIDGVGLMYKLQAPGASGDPPFNSSAPLGNPTNNKGSAISNCQNVLSKVLLLSPENATAYGKLPAKALVAGSSTTSQPAALADGWGNPIIFVPSSGLSGVKIGSFSSNGATSASSNTVTITAPDNRPFWASPGPDGDFSTGDDNVYSFQQ